MAYKVIENFFDTDDNMRLYEVGQTYPREGVEVTEERVDYLSNKNGDFKKPFIKYVANEIDNKEISNYPKHTGGGWYELSNGEKVHGKEEAVKAEETLKSGE